MTTKDVGDRINVRYLAYVAGVPGAATLAIAVTDPSGNVTNPTVTFTAPNIYDASFKLTAGGRWAWRWTASGTIDDVQDGAVDAGDPAPPAYASLIDLKSGLTLTTDDRDDRLTQVLLASARAIDRWCGRRFYLDPVASARVFNPRDRVVCGPDGEQLLVDDIGSTAGLIVEVGSGASWTAITDYDTGPDNALIKGDPITWLLRPLNRWQTWPTGRVRITSQWGYPSVPDDISEANLIQANRIYKRKDSPEGVIGTAEWGAIRVSRIDPDVQAMIQSYQLPGIG